MKRGLHMEHALLQEKLEVGGGGGGGGQGGGWGGGGKGVGVAHTNMQAKVPETFCCQIKTYRASIVTTRQDSSFLSTIAAAASSAMYSSLQQSVWQIIVDICRAAQSKPVQRSTALHYVMGQAIILVHLPCMLTHAVAIKLCVFCFSPILAALCCQSPLSFETRRQARVGGRGWITK